MRFFDWLAKWVNGNPSARGERRRRDHQRRIAMMSERLETRQLPAVFTVRPEGQAGSLRDAVTRANQNRQSDVIQLYRSQKITALREALGSSRGAMMAT